MIDVRRLYRQYRELLLDGVVPFWFERGIDWIHGGVLTCMTEDGAPISGDKYIWSQARSLWTFSALYNRIEKRPEFLEAARNSLRFLLAHGRDPQGRWVYHTNREGQVVEGPISIFSDCFVVYGLSEYCRADPDSELITLARATLDYVRRRVEEPDFQEIAPEKLTPGNRPHAIPMILTEVSSELAQTTGDRELENCADQYAARVMNCFVRPDRKVLLEFLNPQYEELPPPLGSLVNPGHAIESMWFILHLARRRGDRDLVRRATEVIAWHLEAGWDAEYGGIYLGIDATGGEPLLPNAEKKVWWPHTEALYALLLAHRLTQEGWCLEWYEKVHEWSFSKFAMPEVGEWRQRLDRRGNPITDLIALPVKDPFHLPRAAILILQLLGASDGTW